MDVSALFMDLSPLEELSPTSVLIYWSPLSSEYVGSTEGASDTQEGWY